LRTAVAVIAFQAFAATGRYVAASRTPSLMPLAIAKVMSAVALVSGAGWCLGSARFMFQKPSGLCRVRTAFMRSTKRVRYVPYSARVLGNSSKAIARAPACHPMPRPQKIFLPLGLCRVLYDSSRNHSLVLAS
jgi:hypothetical protein